MTQSLAQAQATVTELVELFHRNLGANKEAEVRHEFVEQFFEALSWDAHNVARYAERYKNVVPERSPHVTAGLEAPSYAVPVGGARRFFVEVNRPTVSLKAAAKPTYELRRYAWSPPPQSLLTNLAELAVYECTKRPRESPQAKPERNMG